MTKKTAELLANAAAEFDREMTVRPNYSGRGMFGGTTTAVIYTSDTALRLAIAQAACDIGRGNPANWDREFHDFVQDIGDLRFDNLGNDRIAY